MSNPYAPPTSTIILASPHDQPQAQAIAAALQQAGWTVITTPDPQIYAGQAQTCAVLLAPQTLNDPYVGAAIQANFPCLIPVLTEPLTLPDAPWSVAAVFVAPESAVTATAIAQTATQSTTAWSFLSPYDLASAPPLDSPALPLAHSYDTPPTAPQAGFSMAPIAWRFTSLAPWQRALAVGLPILLVLFILLVAFVHPTFGGGVQPITPQINVAGTWNETIIAGNFSTANNTLALQQSGKNITGTLTDANGNTMNLTGTISGFAITLDASGTTQFGGTVTIQYQQQGTVANDAKRMQGTIKVAATILSQNVAVNGTWNATR